jgi:hypothetical protein
MVDLQIIAPLIHIIRGHRVILDSDLAKLYGVPTKRLNEACNRNLERFPKDFRFQLNKQEVVNLKSQIATSSEWGGARKLPYAFSEHGAIMAANLLRSKQAIDVSIKVVRAFVAMRQMIGGIQELEKKIQKLENKVEQGFEGVDAEFENVYETIRKLILYPEGKKNKIGFV